MPACGPVRLMAATPRAWRAIDTSVALWCSPVASRTSSSRGSGLVGDGRGEAQQLVGRVAHRRHDDDEVVAGRAFARDAPGDALDAVRAGDRRAAELLDDEGGGHSPGILPPPVPAPPSWATVSAGRTVPAAREPTMLGRFAYRLWRRERTRRFPPGGNRATRADRRRPTEAHRRAEDRPPMCFDHDSRPPIAPIAGGALDGSVVDPHRRRRQRLRRLPGATDRRRPAAGDRHPPRRARAASVTTRSWPCASRSTASTPSPSTGSAGRPACRPAARPSSTCRTSSRRRGPASAPTSGRGRRAPGRRRRPRRFTIGFCMGGRMSFLAATLGLDLAGVIGLYGTLVGPWRNDAPEPVARRRPGSSRRRSSACSAGPTGPSRPSTSPRSSGPDRRRRRAPDRDLPGRAAQLLRPQGGRLRRRERRGVGRGQPVRRRDLARRAISAWPGTRRRR